MYFSMKQYTVACDDVACDVTSDEEMARVGDLPDSSELTPEEPSIASIINVTRYIDVPTDKADRWTLQKA